MLAYSRQWGVIEDLHDEMVIPGRGLIATVEKAQTTTGGWVKQLPVAAWRTLAEQFAAALRVSEILIEGEVPERRDLALLEAHFVWAHSLDEPTLPADDPEMSNEQLIATGARSVTRFVQRLLERYVRVAFDLRLGGEPTFSLRPLGLMGGLALPWQALRPAPINNTNSAYAGPAAVLSALTTATRSIAAVTTGSELRSGSGGVENKTLRARRRAKAPLVRTRSLQQHDEKRVLG